MQERNGYCDPRSQERTVPLVGRSTELASIRQVGHALAAAGAPAITVVHHLFKGSEPGDAETVEWWSGQRGRSRPLPRALLPTCGVGR